MDRLGFSYAALARRRAARCAGALIVLATGVVVGSTSATAQESRAALIAAKQAEKAKQLRQYQPTGAEQFIVRFNQRYFGRPNGIYPLFGSVYPGGGLALGATGRRYYGDNTLLEASGLWSIRNYKWLELSTSSLGLWRGRADVRARGGWRDATRVAFYGLGTATSKDDRANFSMQQRYVGVDAAMRPVVHVVLGAALGYENYATESGRGAQPSIEERFDAGEAPGLGADPAFIHTSARAGIDWRPAAGYARKGGLYELRYHNFSDVDDVHSFDRLEAEIVQHLPVLRETWVFSVRGRVETILGDGDRVPYFLLPSLGSGSTLRGFHSWRFRDRHSVLLQGEWRWVPNRYGMDMALFVDAGKVARRRSELDFDGLKTDVGIGVRFHGPTFTPVRIELARGNEGLRIVFAGSAAF
jgi:hypothetical protein